MSLCCDSFETFKFLVFQRISLYSTGVKENIRSGSILLSFLILILVIKLLE